MGVARAPVAGSGGVPACRARVRKPNLRSGVMAGAFQEGNHFHRRVCSGPVLTIVSAAAIMTLLSAVYVLRTRRWVRRGAWPHVMLIIAAWASALWLAFMLATIIIAVRAGV